MYRLKNNYSMESLHDDIYITKHAKDRFIQRSTKGTNGIYKGNVYRTMRSMIRKSTLISSTMHENNEIHEYRKYMGYIFVCLVTLSEDFWKKDKITIITVKLSKKEIQNLTTNGYRIDELGLTNDIIEKMCS